jgi:hypothetical protein
LNSQGVDVAKWQEFLKNKGYLVDASGVFDDLTQAATENYQSSLGVDSTGIVDNDLWGKAGFELAPSVTGFNFSKSEDKNDLYESIKSHYTTPFSFNINNDALYEQLKGQYIRQADLAAENVMGQAAALTGGYGNSYATTAASQAYQNYLGGLNDVSLDLYQAALDRYTQKGDNLLNHYSVLKDIEADEYSRYTDELKKEESEYKNYLDIIENYKTEDEPPIIEDKPIIAPGFDETIYQTNKAANGGKSYLDQLYTDLVTGDFSSYTIVEKAKIIKDALDNSLINEGEALMLMSDVGMAVAKAMAEQKKQ